MQATPTPTPPPPPVTSVDHQQIRDFVNWFKKLPTPQKTSLAALALIVLSLPVSVIATLNEVRNRSKAAYPISPPISPPITFPGPTPTLSPTPQPSVRPTPAPTPQVNVPPVITTTSLPDGYVRRGYTATVAVTDKNPNDSLIVSHSALPKGLSWGRCASSTGPGGVSRTCQIYGTPAKAGFSSITITVKDSKGATVRKVFKLQIRPWYTIPQPSVLPWPFTRPTPQPTNNPM